MNHNSCIQHSEKCERTSLLFTSLGPCRNRVAFYVSVWIVFNSKTRKQKATRYEQERKKHTMKIRPNDTRKRKNDGPEASTGTGYVAKINPKHEVRLKSQTDQKLVDFYLYLASQDDWLLSPPSPRSIHFASSTQSTYQHTVNREIFECLNDFKTQPAGNRICNLANLERCSTN